MKSKLQILCPEYVPLENKGEEAIIRGTIDVLSLDCEYHIVDNNSDKYYKVGNLHVHPGSLFFSDWRSREFNMGWSFNQLYSSACSLIRNGLNKFFPFWIRRPHKQAVRLAEFISNQKKVPEKYKQSIELLKKVDFIIAGHNGGLDEYVCHILNELHKIGKPYGIFGSSMKPKLKEKNILKVFEKTFVNSKFNIARNPIGYRWAIKYFPNCSFDIKPDPAFGMFPENEEEITKLIKKLGLSDFLSKETIMFTTAEPAPISRFSFNSEMSSANKIKAHRKFLSDFLKLLIEKTNYNVLFLPHTIGPSRRMDDREIAKDVVLKAGFPNEKRVMILKADLTAKQLKGIIRLAHFLVAERVHSIIGAIGVNTPFMCFASSRDTRVDGIIKEQMNLGEHIYYLDLPSHISAFEKFKGMIDDRVSIVNKLKKLNINIKKSFDEVVNQIGGNFK